MARKPLSLDVLSRPGGGASLLWSEEGLVDAEDGTVHPVRNGIVYLLPRETWNAKTKEREKEGWKAVAGKNDWGISGEAILGLPYSSEDLYWQETARAMAFVLAARDSWENATGLDLACGIGWATAIFARAGARMIAADFNDTEHNGLGSAVTLRDCGVDFDAVCCDGEELPVADESLDFVFVCSALHHFTRPEASLREIFRVLKRDGLLIDIRESFRTPLQRPESEPEGTQRSEFLAAGINERNYTQREYERLFREAGFALTTLLPAWDLPDPSKPPHEWIGTRYEKRRREHPSVLVRLALSLIPAGLAIRAARWRLLHCTAKDRAFIARKP